MVCQWPYLYLWDEQATMPSSEPCRTERTAAVSCFLTARPYRQVTGGRAGPLEGLPGAPVVLSQLAVRLALSVEASRTRSVAGVALVKATGTSLRCLRFLRSKSHKSSFLETQM